LLIEIAVECLLPSFPLSPRCNRLSNTGMFVFPTWTKCLHCSRTKSQARFRESAANSLSSFGRPSRFNSPRSPYRCTQRNGLLRTRFFAFLTPTCSVLLRKHRLPNRLLWKSGVHLPTTVLFSASRMFLYGPTASKSPDQAVAPPHTPPTPLPLNLHTTHTLEYNNSKGSVSR